MTASISIILRCCNDAWCLRDTLTALSQQMGTPFELVAVDNASTDGSAELLRERADQFMSIPAGEYEPGPVLNAAVGRSSGAIVVLLNSDATPQHPEWLERLVAPLDPPSVAAVYGRQVARPDASPLVTFDLERAYPPHERRADGHHFFSFVSAAFRRSRWEEERFWHRGYAEDYEWTLRLHRAGFDLRYVPDSVVMHSHNYALRDLWWKRFRHGWADSKIYGRAVGLTETLSQYGRDVARDLVHCLPRGQVGGALHSPIERFVQRFAFYRGALAAVAEGGPAPDSSRRR